ncbi:hypothetical protein [Actinoallomurus oryzae]|uniref:hypothetical protein n=1 Tax=Actinoallomurus oryzae TaxID=502180 RepID=UPI0031E614F2
MGHRTGTRWAALIAGTACVAGGIALGSGPYHDRQAFEKAGYCGAVARDDCVTRMDMTVVSRSTYTTEDPDPDPPQQPPPPPPPPAPGPFRWGPSIAALPVDPIVAALPVGRVVAALPMSQTTHYRLTVRTADGERHTFEVDHTMYATARAGTRGTAEVWHGRISRLRIGSHSDDEWSYWSLGFAWVIGWIGVMLIIAFALPLPDSATFPAVFAWWMGVVLFAGLHTWPPALWVIPLAVGGVFLLYRVCVAVAR